MHDCTASADDCVLYEPITFTAGPSTFHFDGTGHWEVLGQLDCAVSGSPSTAACEYTIGDYPQSELTNLRNSWITTSAPSSLTSASTFTDGQMLATQVFTEVTVTGTAVPAAGTASMTASTTGGEGGSGATASGAGRAAGMTALAWPCVAAALGLSMVLL